MSPMEIIKVDKSNYQHYQAPLLKLYIDSFSTGLSAQTIDAVVTGHYLDTLFEEGYGIFIVEKEELIGALLATPLTFDDLIPDKIRQNFLIDNCVYIAEMMVNENARGKGLGTQLLEEFLRTVDQKRFSHAFIRVWVENVPAINLYRKMGYADYATIDQVKTRSDQRGTFVMKKIYLYRKTD